jgi:CRISPR-associated endonuclease/helicase Cas3
MPPFSQLFRELTGYPPFPWQQALYARFVGQQPGGIPQSCSLPTGLGKTSVVAVWLIALATHPHAIPRRLLYVVNRRTVVDQTTSEVEGYRTKLNSDPLRDLHAALKAPLAISTLRGEFADNGDWCEDPSRPAVICGTVDMIGSRLLFSGYGVGRAKRPLHAGVLGQDTLLVHDEAHLEPAFQHLVESIQQQQLSEPAVPWPKLQVMELTATSKSRAPFALSSDDYADTIVQRRMHATKQLHLHKLSDPKKPAKELTAKALSFKTSGNAILVFAQTVDTVRQIQDALEKEKLPVQTLTGTMRGHERDKLVQDKIFARFLPTPPDTAQTGTVYLVCTSAGEVGVNISADHLICDLTPFDSMAQRFGRVNRFGNVNDCEVHVFVPTDWDEKHPLKQPLEKTKALLQQLNGNASPHALGQLPADERSEAFTPAPVILPATDMLFDAWALTSITDKLPGRPAVDAWLHGLSADWDPPTTQVAWRSEVELLQSHAAPETAPDQQAAEDRHQLAKLATSLLEDYPLKPMELLSDRSVRVHDEISRLAQKHPEAPAWIVDADGTVAVHTLSELAATEKRDGRKVPKVSLDNSILLLPPSAGGLNDRGMLEADAVRTEANSLDIADLLREATSGLPARCRTRNRDDAQAAGMQLIKAVLLPSSGSEESDLQYWYWFVRRNTGQVRARKPVLLDVHVADVERRMIDILRGLSLDEALVRCLTTAARFHDHGKKRAMFQAMLGNRQAPQIWWAKSGPKTGLLLEEKYRHEFGSLHDLPTAAELQLSAEQHQLVLHLIAAHHGRARPHFPADEVFDPSASVAADTRMAQGVPQRFGRLQRQFGRWGLAYLESLLRAADWSASANPSAEVEDSR